MIDLSFMQIGEKIFYPRVKPKANPLDYEINQWGVISSSSIKNKKVGSGRSLKSFQEFKKSSIYKKINATINKKPQVVVKVTGYSKGGKHVKSNLEYISRNGKLEIETDNEQIFSNKKDINDLKNDWANDVEIGRKRETQRDTMHLTLSLPEASNEDLKDSVREFAKKNFNNYDYVMALHDEENKTPHVHLIVKCLDKDRKKRIRTNPKIVQKWREDFAEELERIGIEADASYRQTRGKLKRPEKSIIYHKKHPKIIANRFKEASESIINKDNFYDKNIAKDRYLETKEAWEELSKAVEPFDKNLSKKIKNYVIENFNELTTKQEDLKKKIKKDFSINNKIIKNNILNKKKDIDKDKER